jgi:type VI secretion system protein ImpH
MDAPNGQPAADLTRPSVQALGELRLGFVPLVRLLERLVPDAVRVGGEGPPALEGIRFRHDRELQFHAGDVVALGEDVTDDGSGRPLQFQVTSSFLGLSGSMSPLPAYFSEELLHEDDEAPVRRDFFDLFHHRLLSLFYRAVVRYRLSSEHTTRLDDGWSRRSLALAAIDAYGPVLPGGLSGADLLTLAPVLVHRSRGAPGLEAALRAQLGSLVGGAPISVKECFGRWTEVDQGSWTRLGRDCSHLGQDLLVGHRLFDRSGCFAVAIGPTTWAVYERLRPGGDLHQRAAELVAWIVRDPLDWVLLVTLLPNETPGLQLSSRGTSRLGRSTWLRTRSEQTVLTVEGTPCSSNPRPSFVA